MPRFIGVKFMSIVKGLSGPEIESLSMKIIEKELGPTDFSDDELKVVKRVIHATADFEFARTIRFKNDPLKEGIKALREGSPIVTDTRMAASGISKNLFPEKAPDVIVPISMPDTKRICEERGGTLSEAAMELCIEIRPGIIIIGNAPTALLKVIQLIDEKKISPRLVIGVPVGFVNARESKDMLFNMENQPLITCLGRKGGTPVAVAIMNAIIRLAFRTE